MGLIKDQVRQVNFVFIDFTYTIKRVELKKNNAIWFLNNP